jgi:hypothetical protein
MQAERRIGAALRRVAARRAANAAGAQQLAGRSGALVLGGWLLGACSALPPWIVTTESASIHGYDPHRTPRLASAYAEDREFLLGRLPGARAVQLELWEVSGAEQRRLRSLEADGLTERHGGAGRVWPLYGEERVRVLLAPDAGRSVLTHELVHALLGPEWSALPPALEEGLADRLAFERHPHTRGPWQHWNTLLGGQGGALLELRIARGRGQGLGSQLGWLPPERAEAPALSLANLIELGGREPWRGLAPAQVRQAYAAGYALLVRIDERHGLEGLLERCRATQAAGRRHLSAAEVLELADLPDGRFAAEWLEERRDLALAEIDLLSLSALEVAEDLYARGGENGESAAEFLERLDGRLSGAGRGWIPWRKLPNFAAFEEALALRLEARSASEQAE